MAQGQHQVRSADLPAPRTSSPSATRASSPRSTSWAASTWSTPSAATAGLGAPVPVGRRLRVGIPAELGRPGVLDAEITRALTRTAGLLRTAGHDVVEADLGELWDCRADAWQLCARDAWDGSRHWRARIDDDLLDSTHAALRAGADVGDEEYAAIRERMTRLRGSLHAHFADRGVDAWLLPLDPALPRPRGTVAPAASTIPVPGDPRYDREIGFTPVASFAGLPAITFPAGVDAASDAPVAMQLLAGPRQEGALIAAARDVSDALGDLGLRPRDVPGARSDVAPGTAGIDAPPVRGIAKE
ncbi:amidase family protein [Streptomyces sp. NPDC002553]|uniref:amidase family protein n=1 Tax=Streptomyces sp. NPDC002553 TaxID=3154417 RepID=UPI0033294172